VLGPILGLPLLARVSQLPAGDFRVGAPFFLSAVLCSAAFVLALVHFGRSPTSRR
jgi:DHA1 family tetracycline resistance protein-like MFS transporter